MEAAIVDGAGFWRRLFYVELPLLLPVVAVAVLFGVVYTATDLGVVYILTGGGRPTPRTCFLPSPSSAASRAPTSARAPLSPYFCFRF